MINIAILGYGYWGPNLVRNFNKLSNCNISYIVDKDINKLNEAKKLYPNLRCVSNPLTAIKDKTVNAVVIALPVSQHYKYAKLVLENNKHLLIEKPATNSYKKLTELANIAKKRKLQLMVDYTFLYTAAIQKIKKFIDTDFIGNILFINAQRYNNIYRKDVNIIGDLAIHDISIFQYLLQKVPNSLMVKGFVNINKNIKDTVYINLKYDKTFADISSSWLFPFKSKKMIICGSKKTIVYDDIEPVNKIKIYDSVYSILKRSKILDYNKEKIFIPKLNKQEALYSMCNDFLSSIKKKYIPVSNIDFALKINKILEACNKSITYNGKEIKL